MERESTTLCSRIDRRGAAGIAGGAALPRRLHAAPLPNSLGQRRGRTHFGDRPATGPRGGDGTRAPSTPSTRRAWTVSPKSLPAPRTRSRCRTKRGPSGSRTFCARVPAGSASPAPSGACNWRPRRPSSGGSRRAASPTRRFAWRSDGWGSGNGPSVGSPAPIRRTREKKARDRLIRLARSRPDRVLGFQDEVWWSRLALPSMRGWSSGRFRSMIPIPRRSPATGCCGPTPTKCSRGSCGAARRAKSPRTSWRGSANAWPRRASGRCCWCGTTPRGTSAGARGAGSRSATGEPSNPAGCGSWRAFCRSKALGSIRSSRNGSTANGPSSNRTARFRPRN